MRLFLTVLLPLLAPALLYIAWLILRARRGEPPPLRHPVLWLAGSGVAFLLLVLGAWALSEGAPPHAVYVPARLENGRIVEGHSLPGLAPALPDGAAPLSEMEPPRRATDPAGR